MVFIQEHPRGSLFIIMRFVKRPYREFRWRVCGGALELLQKSTPLPGTNIGPILVPGIGVHLKKGFFGDAREGLVDEGISLWRI